MCEGEHKLKGNFENLIKEGVLREKQSLGNFQRGKDVNKNLGFENRKGSIPDVMCLFLLLHSSVPDPYVFGPPGSNPYKSKVRIQILPL